MLGVFWGWQRRAAEPSRKKLETLPKHELFSKALRMVTIIVITAYTAVFWAVSRICSTCFLFLWMTIPPPDYMAQYAPQALLDI